MSGKKNQPAKLGNQNWAECATWEITQQGNASVYTGTFTGFYRAAQVLSFKMELSKSGMTFLVEPGERDTRITIFSTVDFQQRKYFARPKDGAGKPLEKIHKNLQGKPSKKAMGTGGHKLHPNQKQMFE